MDTRNIADGKEYIYNNFPEMDFHTDQSFSGL